MQNSVDRSKEWLKNFKAKMNEGIPKVDKYRGKVVHIKTVFNFTVGDDQYLIICPARKTGNNLFVVYKDGVNIYSAQPRGNHVNKTMAEHFLRIAINHNKSI